MSKICCLGDACPKSSSCSMVLRSACSHRHSRESSTEKKHLHSASPHKRKHVVQKELSHNGHFHHDSLESSEKAYSILTERFFDSFEISRSTSNNVIETSSLNVSCAKELHFSPISPSNNSFVYNNINQREYCSDYSSAVESDMTSSGESVNSISNMTRSTRLTRSALPSVRSLSCSEDEDDISVHSIVRPRQTRSERRTNLNTERQVFAEGEANNQYLSNNHASYHETHHDTNSHFSRFTGSSDSDNLSHMFESSYLDRSSIQNSVFHRFRWFLWRCTYMQMIKIINFDVFILSRIHNYGKHKAIFFFLLPLILYLIWGLIQHNLSSRELPQQPFISVISYVYEYFSSILSSMYGFFYLKKEEVPVKEIQPESCPPELPTIMTFFSTLNGLVGTVSNWFVRTGESAYLMTDSNHPTKEFLSYNKEEETTSIRQSKDEIRNEVFTAEINSLKEFLKSSLKEIEDSKLEKNNILKNEIRNLHLEFQFLKGTVARLEKDIIKQGERSETKENVIIAMKNEYKSNIDQLNLKLKSFEANLKALESYRHWSEEDILALLEKHLILAFKNVVDAHSDTKSKYYFFNEWLSSNCFSHEKLWQEIEAALRKQSSYSDNKLNYDNVLNIIESTVLRHVESIKETLSELKTSGYSSFSADMFSEDRVKKIVKEAIMLYDADKTGQVDYALESGGGSVVGTRCSETYAEKYGKTSIFGVPLWTNSNSPRTAIQPDVEPGRCWAFKGSQGFLVIELSATIYPTGFTLEHIPVSLSPSGSIDSAPKNFSVWGLDSEKDSKGQLLGEYIYDLNGEPLQYFAVKNASEKPYSYVELQILSNHGNMEYTCLYRIRVHGKRVR